MRSYTKTITLFLFSGFLLLTSAGGCTYIAEGVDCEQACSKMRNCYEGDLDVDECSHRCEGEVHDTELAEQLDACTDCMDRNYSCDEITDHCSSCDEIQQLLLD